MKMLKAVVTSARFREDLFDIAKIIAGVIAAKYGVKLM